MSAATEYDVTKNELTQIYDRVNEFTDDAGDPPAGNQTVIESLNSLHSEVERILPAAWWQDRDEQFEELRTFLKSVEDTDRRKTRAIEFVNHMTTLLLDSDLHIEP